MSKKGPKKSFIQKREGLLREDSMRKQTYSVRPGDEGRTWPLVKMHVYKRKERSPGCPQEKLEWD